MVQTFTISDDDAADDFTITITNRADDSATLNPPFSLNLANYPCKVSSCSLIVDPSDESKRGSY